MDDCLFIITTRVAGPQGFEPRPTGPEPVVLPLDDGPSDIPKSRSEDARSQ